VVFFGRLMAPYRSRHPIHETTRTNDLFAWTRHGTGTLPANVNGLNQLDAWDGTLTYDAKGNVVSHGTRTYTWTSENLLATLSGTAVRYDPTMRFAFVSGIRFLRFGDQFIGEYYNGNVVQRYVPGDGLDDTVAEIHANGARYQQYADERGSIIAEAPDSGLPTPYSFDEYGRPGTTSGWRMGFTGQLRLGSTTPLYDFRNRLYDARIGRFLQPDPSGIRGGLNHYAYSRGDPVNRIDPFGLEDIPFGLEDIVVTRCRIVVNGECSDKSGMQFIFESIFGPDESEKGDPVPYREPPREKKLSKCMKQFLSSRDTVLQISMP
jgi:RHS repeat-associated protein